MTKREIPAAVYKSKTKNKILAEATRLFALNGFGAVSMSDIGKEVGIKKETIYYYYEGKEALFSDIMQRFVVSYKHYFEWLHGENQNAATLDELMENMFNSELIEMFDLNNCLGMSLAIREQHNSESARKVVLEIILDYSIKCIKEDFDNLVDKGIIPSSNTQATAEILMNGIMVLNDILINEYYGEKIPFDYLKMNNNLKAVISVSLSQSGGSK